MLKILSILLLLCGSWAQAADLAWNASVVDEQHAAPDGYRIHWGAEPGVYTGQVDVGNQLFYHIPDDYYGTFYFVASAYNEAGQSGFSNEVLFTRDQPQQHIGAIGLRASRYEVEGQMTISRLGYQRFTDGSDPSANSLTVPANTKAVAVLAAYYDSTDGLTSVDIDGSLSFTVSGAMFAGMTDHVAIAYYIGAVSAGAHTLNINWASSRDYMGAIYVVYIGADGTLSLADVEVAAGASRTATVSVGDYILAIAALDASATWTNATEINEGVVSLYDALAELTADGTSETISVNDVSTALGIIAFHETSGGGASAVPVIMRSYRARRN